MRGRISSLNAAVAGSILLYEASSQRGGDRPQFQNPFTEPAGIDYEPVDEASEPGAFVEPEAVIFEPVALAPDPEVAPEPVAQTTVPEVAAEREVVAEVKPKARRRTAKSEVSTEELASSEDEALLPGPSAIDSGDAAPAE
jgi:hypothetical protein